MAGSTTSSMTSSTLTHAPSMAFLSNFTDPSRPGAAADMLALFDSIQPANRHAFLQPSSALSTASLQLAKATLDAYAPSLSDELQQRHNEANKKRKRGNAQPAPDLLKIRKLHVDGFESPQVWQQARRIITSTLQDSQEAIDHLKQDGAVRNGGDKARAAEPELAEDDFDSQDELLSGDELEELDGDEEDLDSLGDEEDAGEGLDDEDDDEDMPDDLDLTEDYEDGEENSGDDEEAEAEELVEDPDGLNDGFFSIDDFNKHSQWFEDQDAKADPTTDAASDDEEFDWHGDPFAGKPSAKARDAPKSKSKNEDDMPSDMEDDDDDMDGGPTFGNADLDAPEGESEDDDDDDEEMGGALGNANDIFYKDFFAPPQRKGAKKNNRQNKFQQSLPTEPDDRDVDRAMADVRRDLFEDESERSDSEDALSDASAGDPKSRRSAHERRQAKLAEEIRKLEAANVAKREWTMAGEAQATDRPMNSLLEEDLDFEHVGKPVPVITAEVSESIEDMIKRRILAQEFDEVIKRRPDSAELSGNTRRGLVELSDAKNQQSLADIYEEEHVKNANPDTYVSSTDERLRRDEREVETLWKDVCAKLDALSSWHYRPRPVEPSLQIVSDVGTVSMEDAQPTTAQGVSGGDTALAPQEIYKAGQETADKGEVVAKDGLPVARQEMSREDKTRRRRRDKERIRKAGGLAQGGSGNGVAGQKALPGAKGSGASKRAQEQKETLGELKKGGVRVINKKGEVVDMDGNKAKAKQAATSGSFKL